MTLHELVAELRRLDAEATPGPLPEPLPNRAVVLPKTRDDLLAARAHRGGATATDRRGLRSW